MSNDGQYTFKVATEEREFEQLFRLNYETFVEELPQHEENETGRLVDRFHDENTYFICLRGEQLAGMIAVRDKRPFSLDQKLGSVDDYLPTDAPLCEIRLLSIRRDLRSGRILHGLLSQVVAHCIERGYGMALISGSTQRLSLYEKFGFRPFGPVVGTPEASFQPMYRPMDNLLEEYGEILHPSVNGAARKPINFLPGPVAIHPDVRRAFEQTPISHRSPAFVARVQQVKSRLCALVNANNVELLLGSGTLANDAVAAQLSLEEGPGLILSNGEFGDRLLDHARRHARQHDAIQEDWGQPFDESVIEEAIKGRRYAWLWAVHNETSTGILTDIAFLKRVCSEHGIKLALDCISSVGTTPVDLDGVHLASGASGKGLGSYPGISMVFYNHHIDPQPDRLPRYLDLGLLAEKDGVPFTTSSNLILAMEAALERFAPDSRFTELEEMTSEVRTRLRQLGFTLLGDDQHVAPSVVSVVLPPGVKSREFGDELERDGFLLSYGSDYLINRNWVQVCLMGEVSMDDVDALIGELQAIAPRYSIHPSPVSQSR